MLSMRESKEKTYQENNMKTLVSLVGKAEDLIKEDQEVPELSFNSAHLAKMKETLTELLVFRNVEIVISPKMEEKYRYVLRYLSETLYIAGKCPKLEG